MDTDQDQIIHSLSFFGIYKESFNILSTWRKIFSQITLTLIVPLSLILLAHLEISHLIFWNFHYTPYYQHEHTQERSDWLVYLLFNAAYYTFLLIFSLLSTSAVVYTIASVYTNRDVTYKKVMRVVPKVWKRLMVTFLVIFVTTFIYIVVAVVSIILVITVTSGTFSAILFIILIILFSIGFVYMTIVWQLASVVTVLETSYGVKAMMKSKDLIKGKFWVALVIFLMLNVLHFGVQVLFLNFVVLDTSLLSKIGFGLLCFLMLTVLILFGLVIQTVLYFVCKSYHNERIDKPSLSKHLGEYERLNKETDVELGQV